MASPSASAETKKRLALAIIDFLSASLKDGTLAPGDQESIEIAQSCIAESFKVDPANKAAMQDAVGGQSLLSIYGVYEKLRGAKATSSSSSSSSSSAPSQTPAAASGSTSSHGAQAGAGTAASDAQQPSAEQKQQAEQYKSQGNTAMGRKDYAAAISAYSRALELVPANAIYLSNRAAAYSASQQHALACADAELAVAIDPAYTKAWSRLGLARYALGDARGSMEAYQQGIAAEGGGGSDAMRRGYETAKRKVEQEQAEEEAAAGADAGMGAGPGLNLGGDGGGGAGGAGGGMPDLAGLASMLGGGAGGRGGGGGAGGPDLAGLASMLGGAGGGRGGGGGGGAGGAGGPDLAGLMNNPMFAGMAQQLLSNPQMMSSLMNNPRLRQMAENMGSSGGGTPDIGSLMSDPSIAELARNFGLGGGAGRGGPRS